jgi:hypothetical protein
MAGDTGSLVDGAVWDRNRGPGGGRACGWSCSISRAARWRPAAYRLVRQCLITLGIPDPVLVRVGDCPSPTVLVNGTDVMRPTEELSKARVCRIDVPTRERVLAALKAARAPESRDESFHRDQPLDPPPYGSVYPVCAEPSTSSSSDPVGSSSSRSGRAVRDGVGDERG